jgi:hypothetical protein
MVTIPAGSLTAAITLTPIDDAIAEGNETVVLLLAAGDGYRVDTARRRATVNITDNEPTVSITASDATATENNTTVATFTVSRTGTPAGDLTVNYSVAGTASGGEGGGGDYIALPGSVTIPDGQVSALITLMPIDDSVGEGSETVILTLTAGTAYSRNAARTTARAAIADNEPAVSITATDSAAAEVTDAEPNVGMFTVVRTGSTVGSLTIPYTVSGSAATDGTDYAVVEGSITIPDGSSNATMTAPPSRGRPSPSRSRATAGTCSRPAGAVRP